MNLEVGHYHDFIHTQHIQHIYTLPARDEARAAEKTKQLCYTFESCSEKGTGRDRGREIKCYGTQYFPCPSKDDISRTAKKVACSQISAKKRYNEMDIRLSKVNLSSILSVEGLWYGKQLVFPSMQC